MQASNAPSKSAVPFAESGTKNTIPVASQIGVTPGAASFTDGFPPLTMTPLAAGGVPPYGADFNGILNFLSAAVRWSQAGGRYTFDAAFATAVGGYPKGAVLASTSGGMGWVNLIDNNTADPDSSGLGWAEIAVPAGGIQWFAMQAPPNGWLKANGAAVSVTAYSRLATNIYCGNSFNATALFGYRCTDAANPATTRSTTGAYIVLPDLRGEFVRGWDDGRGIDSGRAFGTAQLDAMQNITGTLSNMAFSGSTSAGTGAISVGANLGATYTTGTSGNVRDMAFNASNVVRTATETRARNIAFLACIKY